MKRRARLRAVCGAAGGGVEVGEECLVRAPRHLSVLDVSECLSDLDDNLKDLDALDVTVSWPPDGFGGGSLKPCV